MPKQVSIAATAAVNEPNKAQVVNTIIMGARRYDATKSDGSIVDGVVVLFKDSIPAIIDGEARAINKKWFGLTNIVDALIMSEDDAVAARVAAILDGDYMSLRGLKVQISIFDGDDSELHYKVEF